MLICYVGEMNFMEYSLDFSKFLKQIVEK